MAKQFCKKCNASVTDADALVNNLEFRCPTCNEQLVYFGQEIVKLSPQVFKKNENSHFIPTQTHGSIELSDKTDYKLDSIYLSIQVALKNTPNDIKTLLDLGQFYSAKQHDDLAIETYQLIIEINPKTIVAYKRLATVYAAKKAYLSALNCLKEVAQLAPTDTLVFYNLAIAFMHCQDLENAKKSLEHARKTYPSVEEKKLLDDLYAIINN